MDKGHFRPNRPATVQPVQPSNRYRGGGDDWTNPDWVPASDMLPADLSALVSYELGGGAFTDRVVGGKTERYSLRHLVFEGLGIDACRSRVSSDLVSLHEVISAWEVDDLLSGGESFPIDAGG